MSGFIDNVVDPNGIEPDTAIGAIENDACDAGLTDEQIWERWESQPELLHALKIVLANSEPRSDGLGCCSQDSECYWHRAYSLVNKLTKDRYGEWMEDFA